MNGEIPWPFGRRVVRQVARRCHEDQREARETPGDQAGGWKFAKSECQIDVFREQVDRSFREVDLDREAGMAVKECDNGGREQRGPERQGRGDAEAAPGLGLSGTRLGLG